MLVTRMPPARCWAFLVLGFLLLTLPDWSALLARQEFEIAESMVRVRAKQKISGIVHKNQLLSKATVLEINEFDGVVLDGRGYVVSYIGSSWTTLSKLSPDFECEFDGNRRVDAEFVGIDERTSLLILRVADLGERVPVLGAIRENEEVRLRSYERGAQGAVILEVLQRSTGGLGVEERIRARICCTDGESSQGEVGDLLVDSAGRLLGFVTRMEEGGFNRSVRSMQVLPVQTARNSLADVLAEAGSVRAGWLGILMYPETKRVIVSEVVSDSPAQAAGLRPGDLILQVDDQNIWSKEQFIKAIRWAGPGSEVSLTVERSGEREHLSPKLGTWPASERPSFAWAFEFPRSVQVGDVDSKESKVRFYPVPVAKTMNVGLTVDALTPQLAEYFGSPTGRGLLVSSVLEGSVAAEVGIGAGDVIVELNGEQVSAPEDLQKILESLRDGILMVKLIRDGKTRVKKVVLH